MNKPIYNINKIKEYSFLELGNLLKEIHEYYFKSFDFNETKGYIIPQWWYERSEDRNEIYRNLPLIESEFFKKANN